MQITLSELISYVRKLDQRLSDETMYSDDSLTDKIRYGIDNLSAQVQPFVKEEFIDLSQYIDSGILKFNLPMEEIVLGYFQIQFVQLNGNEFQDLINPEMSAIQQLDKSLYVVFPSAPVLKTFLRVKYFYAPDITATPILEVEPEVWHFMKHSIQIVVWGGLKDYEKEQYHQKVLDQHVSTKILQAPQNSFVPNSMKGGFV